MKLRSILIATIAALTIASCQNAPKEDAYRRHTGFVFGTSYSFIYKSKTDLYKQILDSLAVYDASLSFFNPNSLLSQLNDADSIVSASYRSPRISISPPTALSTSPLAHSANYGVSPRTSTTIPSPSNNGTPSAQSSTQSSLSSASTRLLSTEMSSVRPTVA